jgi:hypothetical protein
MNLRPTMPRPVLCLPQDSAGIRMLTVEHWQRYGPEEAALAHGGQVCAGRRERDGGHLSAGRKRRQKAIA